MKNWKETTSQDTLIWKTGEVNLVRSGFARDADDCIIIRGMVPKHPRALERDLKEYGGTEEMEDDEMEGVVFKLTLSEVELKEWQRRM